MVRRQEFWVKDDGTAKPVEHYEILEWTRAHPNRDVRIVDVGPRRVGIFALKNNGRYFEFDGAYLDKDLLIRILKGVPNGQ